MSQHNSLMEWLVQTRRVNKSVDQICMQTIDSINTTLPYLKRKTITGNKDFFDRFCGYYHKPNPIDLIKKIHSQKKSPCMICRRGDCLDILNSYVQKSINRCWLGIEMAQVMWFEIIDFMFERPELVANSVVMDDYIQEKIEEVCQNNKKNNPLTSEISKRFGKFWKDKDGKWNTERRKRF